MKNSNTILFLKTSFQIVIHVCTSVTKTSFGCCDYCLSKQALHATEDVFVMLVDAQMVIWKYVFGKSNIALASKKTCKLVYECDIWHLNIYSRILTCYYMLCHILSEAILSRPWASVKGSICRLCNPALRGL